MQPLLSILTANQTEIAIVLFGGGFGAFIKEVVGDNCLQMPKFENNKLNLGFLGSVIVGAFVGFVIDGGFITSAMAGFVGFAMIENILPTSNKTNTNTKETIEEIIKRVALKNGVSPELALEVAKCESQLSPHAVNINAPDSIDRGIYQINSKWHPEVTEAQAFDPEFSAQFFCTAFKNGNLSWWEASRKCWDKK